MADAEGAEIRAPDSAGGVAGLCEVGRAFDGATYLPVAGTSMVSSPTENGQIDLLFLGDVLDPHVTKPYPKYSLLVLVCSGNPLEVRGSLAGTQIPAVSRPRAIQTDAGGAWGYGKRTDFRTKRNNRPQIHGRGAHPWSLGRRNGIARGI